jgi:hypothetical protein
LLHRKQPVEEKNSAENQGDPADVLVKYMREMGAGNQVSLEGVAAIINMAILILCTNVRDEGGIFGNHESAWTFMAC